MKLLKILDKKPRVKISKKVSVFNWGVLYINKLLDKTKNL